MSTYYKSGVAARRVESVHRVDNEPLLTKHGQSFLMRPLDPKSPRVHMSGGFVPCKVPNMLHVADNRSMLIDTGNLHRTWTCARSVEPHLNLEVNSTKPHHTCCALRGEQNEQNDRQYQISEACLCGRKRGTEAGVPSTRQEESSRSQCDSLQAVLVSAGLGDPMGTHSTTDVSRLSP